MSGDDQGSRPMDAPEKRRRLALEREIKAIRQELRNLHDRVEHPIKLTPAKIDLERELDRGAQRLTRDTVRHSDPSAGLRARAPEAIDHPRFMDAHIEQLEQFEHWVERTSVRAQVIADRLFGQEPEAEERNEAEPSPYSVVSHIERARYRINRQLVQLEHHIERLEGL